ncbi:hypothetical protein RMSM_07598 [Rhodopirellula maiorica SM1]|uniref:Orc1-like AAA ATPase domain-containing protein n=1 Tax=Rhodopirellula maiorica SM1 TaxID=1265738 RepID=M5R8U8_9BACT|nr:ATP-binding protein [Rhodopirellula maiorica]EMI15476.1 hypothetical protein RMSM_07598 [Rhodopirellula maiorica SM1]
MKTDELKKQASDIVDDFARRCHVTPPNFEIVDKAGDKYLAISVGRVNDIYANHIEQVSDALEEDHPFSDRIFLRQKTPDAWLRSTETQLLEKLISESLTVGRSTLDSEYHKKFIPFLGGEERQIFSDANHVVFGRRGAGKSSLVLYACNNARRENIPFVWIALQQYRGRDDLMVIPQVLYELIEGIAAYESIDIERIEKLRKIVNALEDKEGDLTRKDIDIVLPRIARELLPFVRENGKFYICIDDLHLLDKSLQPYFLSAFYSFARGNHIYLKITAIENFARLYDENAREGLQPPGDAQIIRLDYNLVNPKAAHDHLQRVLNGYVQYAGIPSLASLFGNNVLERLVWVAAGVPRDALYIFRQAIGKARTAGRKMIAVTDINMAAAESLTEKESYINDDAAAESSQIRAAIDDIKQFCLKTSRCNAFLVHIDANDPRYNIIKKVSDLRFLHVLHPGITPEKAGEKYEALMLDYAFYTGFRKAPSVKEFKSQPEQPLAKELRQLDRYPYESRLPEPT